MADDDKTKDQEEQKKKKPMLLFIIIGVVVLALCGGGAYLFLFSGPSDQEIAQEIEAEQKSKSVKQARKEDVEVGVMYPLDPFVVNLADAKARHYVKATIIMELLDDDVKEQADRLLPKIRNDIILLLSSQTLEDVITMEGKIRLRDEITARVSRILGKDSVKNIYFSSFVVQ